MRKSVKTVVVLLDRDSQTHLALPKLERENAVAVPRRVTLCGMSPAHLVAGIPTSQPLPGRCPACYALIDAYGYPKALTGG